MQILIIYMHLNVKEYFYNFTKKKNKYHHYSAAL